jgi:hypothetical protein
MTAEATISVRVRDGLSVYDDAGTEHRGGQALDVSPHTAAQWVRAGFVEPLEPLVEEPAGDKPANPRRRAGQR